MPFSLHETRLFTLVFQVFWPSLAKSPFQQTSPPIWRHRHAGSCLIVSMNYQSVMHDHKCNALVVAWFSSVRLACLWLPAERSWWLFFISSALQLAFPQTRRDIMMGFSLFPKGHANKPSFHGGIPRLCFLFFPAGRRQFLRLFKHMEKHLFKHLTMINKYWERFLLL